jgi:hypothetical protein
MRSAMRSLIARPARVVAIAAGACALAIATPAAAQQLLTNGTFETGTLTGWTLTTDSGSGSVFNSTPGSATPLSSHPTAANATGGTSYAVADQTGASTTALTQTFTVPPGGGTTTLTFQMFVNNWTGLPAIIDPSGLSASGPPNQHARVDLLTAAATPFDTGAGVIRNFYIGSDPNDPNTTLNPYTNYSFDITSNVGGGGGGTFQIRFAQVNNQFYLTQGVDNVSIVFAVATPTMNTWLLVSLGCFLVIVAVMTMGRKGRLQTA